MSTRTPLRNGLRFEVLQRDNFTCRYCGRKAPEVKLHIDHVHPISEGGTNDIDNLVTACQECNSGKRAKVFQPMTNVQIARLEQNSHWWEDDIATCIAQEIRYLCEIISTYHNRLPQMFINCHNLYEASDAIPPRIKNEPLNLSPCDMLLQSAKLQNDCHELLESTKWLASMWQIICDSRGIANIDLSWMHDKLGEV
jgi:hypothetical protein